MLASSSARSFSRTARIEDLLALAGGATRGERALDLAEHARADLAVVGDRRLLLRGAHLHLRLQLAAEEERLHQSRAEAADRVVAALQHEELG